MRLNPHVPAKLAMTEATSVGRKAEVVRNQKVSHSAQRWRTIGKVGQKKERPFSHHLIIWKYIFFFSDILSGTLSGIYYGILSGIYSDTLSDMGTAIPQPRAPDLSRSTDKIQGPSAGRWETLQRFESLLSQHM